MERSGVLLGTMSETGFARAKRLQANVGRILKKGTQRKRRSLCLCFGHRRKIVAAFWQCSFVGTKGLE